MPAAGPVSCVSRETPRPVYPRSRAPIPRAPDAPTSRRVGRRAEGGRDSPEGRSPEAALMTRLTSSAPGLIFHHGTGLGPPSPRRRHMVVSVSRETVVPCVRSTGLSARDRGGLSSYNAPGTPRFLETTTAHRATTTAPPIMDPHLPCFTRNKPSRARQFGLSRCRTDTCPLLQPTTTTIPVPPGASDTRWKFDRPSTDSFT